jgi:hypothetical protein
MVRSSVRDRDWLTALDSMDPCGVPHFVLLESVFPIMTEQERAGFLMYVWRRSKLRVKPARALNLFRAALGLRATVPTEWPDQVTVYRGAWSHTSWPSERVDSIARGGVSWTTDRSVAETFTLVGRIPGVGCIATGRVDRDRVLAYFHDGDEGIETYHEHECIVDPNDVRDVNLERVVSEQKGVPNAQANQ